MEKAAPAVCSLAVLASALLAPAVALAVDPAYRVCLDQYPLRPLERVVFGLDAAGSRLDQLTAEGYRDAAAIEAGSTWDFSPATGTVAVYQQVPVEKAWSCSVGGACGELVPARTDVLRVRDDLTTDNRDVWALDSDASGRLLIRALISAEGTADEQRICLPADVGLFDYPGTGGCLAGGENWSSTLRCVKGVSEGDPCGTEAPAAGLDGSLPGRAVRAGTLTLPSGHVLDALLIEVNPRLDAKLLLAGNCATTVGSLGEYLLYWLVPGYGPIVEMFSPDDALDLDWTSTPQTTIGFGLLPPLQVRVDSTTASSLAVSWTPARDTRFIEEYVVHWGTEPGGVVAPPDSSETRGDTIPVGTNLYTLTGLAPDTTYYVSVTAKGHYTDPVSGIATLYRSIELPESIGADVDGDGVRDTSYPPETSAVTTSGAPLPALLRAWLVDVDPPSPPVAAVLPLDAGDTYLPGFASGGVDPEAVLDDLSRRLVFYGLDAPRTVRLTRAAASTVRIAY